MPHITDLSRLVRTASWWAALSGTAALISLGLSSPRVGFATFWLPSGLLLAALLTSPRSRWTTVVPGALLGIVGATVLVISLPWQVAAGLAVTVALEALAGFLLLRASGGPPSPHRVADMLRLVAVSAIVSAVPGGLMGWLVVSRQYAVPFTRSWVTWWMADLIGILLVAPLLLLSRDEWRVSIRQARGWRGAELGLASGMLLATTLAVYWLPPHPARLVFLLMPWVLWIMFRFSAPELFCALIAIVVVSVRGTIAGHGPLGTLGADDATVFAQLFVSVGLVCFLIFSAALRERETSLLKLRDVKQDALVRHFADTAPAILWAADREGRRTFLSRGWQELSGQPAASGLGSGWLQTLHPEDREPAATAATAAMRTRAAYQIRYRIRSADGRYRWVISAGRPHHDEHGQFVGYVGSLIDVHDHTVATAELARANALLDALFVSAPVGLAFLDRELRFQRLNERFAAFNGITIESHVGRMPTELFPAFEDIANVMSTFRDVVATGEPVFGIEVSGHTPATSGHRHNWRSSYFPVRVAGEDVGVGVVAEDVTEQKRAEQELRDSARRKDEFLAMLAHELRNPLAPIQNAVRLLEVAQTGSPAHAAALEIIDRQLSHVVRLVDDLLDVSRLSRGTLSIRREPTELTSVVRDTATDLEPLFLERGIAFEMALPDGPIWTDGDRTRLAQLVGNLLHNAQKFTPPGGTVRLRLDTTASTATIGVEDTGIGMTADLVARAFDEFSQGNQSLDRTPGGLGLGLALVKRFAELHGGRVEAFSDGPNRGSSFVVHLPVRPMAPADTPAGASSTEMTRR